MTSFQDDVGDSEIDMDDDDEDDDDDDEEEGDLVDPGNPMQRGMRQGAPPDDDDDDDFWETTTDTSLFRPLINLSRNLKLVQTLWWLW